MNNVYPYVTNDGSVGLYNEDFDDIYHSAKGAYAEACEKFVANTDLEYFFLCGYKTIKVLDICYGIGYNTKSLIQKYAGICRPKFFSKQYSEQIYPDNILAPFLQIDTVDTDKNLMILSPLIKKFPKYDLKKQKLPTHRIEKYMAETTSGELYEDWIDIFILEKLVLSNKFADEYTNLLLNAQNNAFKSYINPRKRAYMRFLSNNRYSDIHFGLLWAFVHNIYYHYISNCYKNTPKAFIDKHVGISFNLADARKFIKSTNETYDLIFLDAFSPNKCPCLWTYDFIKQLYEHLSPNGRLITYSSAANIRNAMLLSGFYVGKIYNEAENKFTGTIAVKNKSFIKHELTEGDLRLMKSKLGIVYRDENLNALNEAIIRRHETDVQNSSLMSSSQALKEYTYV